MRRLVVIAALGACRLDFDPTTGGNDGNATTDAIALQHPCGGKTTAPDPVVITGDTYRYANFTDGRTVVSPVTVTALDDTGTSIISTTSDATGGYTLSIPTGGVARPISLLYSDMADFPTTVHFDAPIDRALTAPTSTWFTLGDGPVWSSGSMDAIYGSVVPPVVRDSAKSSVSIEAYDCASMPLEGVAITVTPPPELFAFTAGDGHSDPTLTGTVGPYTLAVGYNAVPGVNHIAASKPGYTFIDQYIVLQAGDFNAIVVIRPVE